MILASLLLAGCSANEAEQSPSPSPAPSPTPSLSPPPSPSPSPPPVDACTSPSEARAAYDGAAAFLAEVGATPATIRITGTLQGEDQEVLFAFDLPNHTMQVTMKSIGLDVRRVGTEYSAEGLPSSGYGRDHDLGRFASVAATFGGLLVNSDRPLGRFVSSTLFGGYNVDCTTFEGAPALRFTIARAGLDDEHLVERAAPHRPLHSRFRGPGDATDGEASFVHAPPIVEVERELPRVAANFDATQLSSSEDAHGVASFAWALGANTSWVPLADFTIEIRSVDGDAVIETAPLAHGLHRFATGDVVEYLDLDANGLLSEGDEIRFELGAERDAAFFDAWAGDTANLDVK